MLFTSVKKVLRLVLPLAVAIALSFSANAQDNPLRELTPGVVVNGVLDEQNVAQVYTYEGTAGEVITVQAISAEGLALALLLTDAAGGQIGQAVDAEATGAVALVETQLPFSSTYFVTVLRAPGAAAPENGSFTLTLALNASAPEEAVVSVPTAEATEAVLQPPVAAVLTPPPSLTYNTSQGVQVSMTWNTTANLDLEVRDPVGGSLYWFTPSVESGGRFDTVNINGGCENPTANAPTEALSWPIGPVPVGSYEVLIYYQDVCDTAATDQSAAFTVNVTVDGFDLAPIEGILQPGEVYLARYLINENGVGTAVQGGVYIEDLAIPTTLLLTGQQTLSPNSTVQGIISNDNFFDTYIFQGTRGDVVSVSMTAILGGSLDTRVFLLDSNGVVVASNDDAASGGTTNSVIERTTLFADGLYTLVATRYGQELGGTEGTYELTLTVENAQQAASANSEIQQQLAALGLVRGDIEVALLWNTGADLQLLVRDPLGTSVFDDAAAIASGGQLVIGGNANCVRALGDPVSYVYWPTGTLRFGANEVYEIEVWYQNTCNDPTLVEPILNVVVQGQVVISQTIPNLRPNERFLTSFAAQADGQVIAGPGGVIGTPEDLEFSSLDYIAELETALELVSGVVARESITLDDKFDLYYFDAEAGEEISIAMEALDGTLDPLLFLVDVNGVELAQNDDAVPNETKDSLIDAFAIPVDGRYYVIVTHYGALYGATSGRYNLTFSRLN